jgi:hypothetical protein
MRLIMVRSSAGARRSSTAATGAASSAADRSLRNAAASVKGGVTR